MIPELQPGSISPLHTMDQDGQWGSGQGAEDPEDIILDVDGNAAYNPP